MILWFTSSCASRASCPTCSCGSRVLCFTCSRASRVSCPTCSRASFLVFCASSTASSVFFNCFFRFSPVSFYVVFQDRSFKIHSCIDRESVFQIQISLWPKQKFLERYRYILHTHSNSPTSDKRILHVSCFMNWYRLSRKFSLIYNNSSALWSFNVLLSFFLLHSKTYSNPKYIQHSKFSSIFLWNFTL